jgi:hypothetical protein
MSTGRERDGAGDASVLPGGDQEVGADASVEASSTDVRSVEAFGAPVLLGNPARVRYPDTAESASIFARNVWDIFAFEGRLYLGQGNIFENKGPTDVLLWDPALGTFRQDLGADGLPFFARDEGLEHYRVIDGRLVVIGWDPQDDGTFGNFYRKEASGWVMHRKLPGGLHGEDITKFGNLWAATIGTTDGTALCISSDDAASWLTVAPLAANGQPFANYTRLFTLFELEGKLYASGTDYGPTFDPSDDTSVLVAYEGANTFKGLSSAAASALFPSAPPGTRLHKQWAVVQGRLVYIGVSDVNAYGGEPVGLFKATSVDSAQAMALPDGATARDVLVDHNALYVLASKGNLTLLYHSPDLASFTELSRIPRTDGTFGRSFERMNGDFYIGFGGDHDPSCPPGTGDVYRVPLVR